MAPYQIGRVREPVRPPVAPQLEAPVSGGARCCAKCGAPDVRPHYHCDGTACQIARLGIFRCDEHLHFVCGCCGYDFTTPCLPGTRSI